MNLTPLAPLPSARSGARIQSNPVKPGAAGQDPEFKKLLNTAREFEAVFINQLMSAMRNSVQQSGLMSGSPAEGMFTGLLDYEYSLNAAKQGQGYGIAEAMVKQFSRKSAGDPAELHMKPLSHPYLGNP
jgi:flagellar protein FlgJ